MAATSASVGIRHMTVVPANFEPPESADSDEGAPEEGPEE